MLADELSMSMPALKSMSQARLAKPSNVMPPSSAIADSYTGHNLFKEIKSIRDTNTSEVHAASLKLINRKLPPISSNRSKSQLDGGKPLHDNVFYTMEAQQNRMLDVGFNRLLLAKMDGTDGKTEEEILREKQLKSQVKIIEITAASIKD